MKKLILLALIGIVSLTAMPSGAQAKEKWHFHRHHRHHHHRHHHHWHHHRWHK